MFKCLIVDDEKNIRERIANHFPWGEYGFTTVETAKDGLEALEMIEENPPQLVFTDVRMPNMDGLKLAENLQLYFPEIIVVIVSSYDDFHLAQKAINYNVKAYLLKPLMKNDFRKVMDKISESSSLKQKIQARKTSSIATENADNYVNFAKKYVQEHYEENLTIKNISAQLFIHEAYFSKIFNETVGEGFNAYVNKVRIEKAKHYLKYTDYQLKDISQMVGFSSPSYFNTVFKQIVKMSPLNFRKKAEKNV